MDSLTWFEIAEVQGRLDADLAKSLLEANDIPVELIQEALGHSLIPVVIDGLGRVQIFPVQEVIAPPGIPIPLYPFFVLSVGKL